MEERIFCLPVLLLGPIVHQAHEQPHGHLLIQWRLPSKHPPHGVGYPSGGGIFEYVSCGTRFEGVGEARRFVDGGKIRTGVSGNSLFMA